MQKSFNTKKIAIIAFFGALSGLLMIFDFPVPIAPSFMKMDLGELPVMIGGFLLGPVSSIIIAVLKILIKIVIKPTSTMYVGELANLIGSIFNVLPASIIYSRLKNKKRAVVGLIVGTILASVACVISNITFTFPFYMNVFHMSEDVIIGMCKAIIPSIDSMIKVMLFSVFPFNIVKYGVTSVITYFFYKHVSKVVKNILK